MNLNDAIGVDEHVSPQLMDIAARRLQSTTPPDQLQIAPNGGEAVDVPPATPCHPIRGVEGSFAIDEQRPLESGFLKIRPGQRPGIKRDDADLHTQFE